MTGYKRAAHFKTFTLPGGDKAAVEPRRVAASILYDLSGGSLEGFDDLAPIQAFSSEELKVLKNMLDKFNACDASLIQEHPWFGKLSKRETKDLLVKHIDHHFKQFSI